MATSPPPLPPLPSMRLKSVLKGSWRSFEGVIFSRVYVVCVSEILLWWPVVGRVISSILGLEKAYTNSNIPETKMRRFSGLYSQQ